MAACSGEEPFCSGPGTTVVRLEIPGTLLEQERKPGNLDKIQEKLQGMFRGWTVRVSHTLCLIDTGAASQH